MRRGLQQRRAGIVREANGQRALGRRGAKRGDGIGSRTAGCDADHDVAETRLCRPHFLCPGSSVVLGALDAGEQRLRTAGEQVDRALGVPAKGRPQLDPVENGEPPRGSRAGIDQPPRRIFQPRRCRLGRGGDGRRLRLHRRRRGELSLQHGLDGVGGGPEIKIGEAGAEIFGGQSLYSPVLPRAGIGLPSLSAVLSLPVMELYLGIDAGGTHTRARLVSGEGDLLGTGEAAGANTPRGLPQALRMIEECAGQAIAEAGLSEDQIASIRAGIGTAGLNRRGFLPGLKAHAFPFRSTAFASDAAIANLGAHAGEDGAIVIVGTGSVGFARIGEKVFTLGGYGFPVSDEGSGAELGLRAIRRSLWARDGRIAHTAMTDAVLERFHGSPGEIVAWTARATPADYGAFAPIVLDHALRGDAVAELIVQDAARRIEAMIRTLFDFGAPQCCLMGGVAARMRDWLAPSVRARLREPLGDAIDGALLLARRRAEQE